MKKSIVLISLLIAKTSLANVSALKCSITGDLVDSKLQVKKYVLPADTGVRKVSYLLSEETKDKMATYNTTVNLYLKTDVNGIQSVEVSAWPQGGARVSSLNRKNK